MPHLKSSCTLILTLTLLPLGLSTSSSMPTAHPSRRNADLVSTTMSRTSSRWFIRAAPSVSAHAHDWGQPQLRSTPLTKGAARTDARESSRGLLAPNWRMVGGWGPEVEMVRSGEDQHRSSAEENHGVRLTSVSGKAAPVELLGQDHRGPAQVGAIVMDSLSEGELLHVSAAEAFVTRIPWEEIIYLAVAHHRRTCREELVLLPCDIKQLEGTCNIISQAPISSWK